MGGKPSKIPESVPGHMLLFTGIEEFDRIYKILEVPVKRIKEAEIELNMYTTDFINSLGAGKVWETMPNMQKLIQVLLVIIAAEGNGTLSLLVDYSMDFPYLLIRPENLSHKNRKIAENFSKMMETLNVFPSTVLKYKNKLEAKIDGVRNFQSEVARKTIKLEYNMKDKLTAVNIAVNNFNTCDRAIKVSKEIERICEEVIESVKNAVQKAQIPPQCEILASRGLQAASEGLTTPSSIVKKFWPIV